MALLSIFTRANDNNKSIKRVTSSQDVCFMVGGEELTGVVDCDIHKMALGETIKATLTVHVQIGKQEQDS